MRLPLPCANVVHRALVLVRHWLFQNEIPYFVHTNIVHWDTWNSLLVNIPALFFTNPHIFVAGDRLLSAISTTHTILQLFRDLSNPSVTILFRSLSVQIWEELIRLLTKTSFFITSKNNPFTNATAGEFVYTLLTVCISVEVIREVDLKDELWDGVSSIFQSSPWPQVVDQWGRVVGCMTHALIFNIYGIDVNEPIEHKSSKVSIIGRNSDVVEVGTIYCMMISRLFVV